MPDPSRHRLIRGLHARREQHRQRSMLYRVAFAAAGFAVALTGVVMLLAPGPALVVIPFGLGMLALEFAWAERLLERALDYADSAQQAARSSSNRQRAALAAAAVACAAAAVAAAVVWDIPVLPV